jgi:hypothetical protein
MFAKLYLYEFRREILLILSLLSVEDLYLQHVSTISVMT